jgi:hypothetical protein
MELHFKSKLKALLANIRLGWRRMAMANALAYHYGRKCFVVYGRGIISKVV